MADTLLTLAAVLTGTPLTVWAVSHEPATPRTWRHHAELAVGVALLAAAVAVAMAGGS